MVLCLFFQNKYLWPFHICSMVWNLPLEKLTVNNLLLSFHIDPQYCSRSYKWLASEVGCKRNDCEYPHDTLSRNEIQAKNFKCVSCKDTWTDSSCEVKHTINDHQV